MRKSVYVILICTVAIIISFIIRHSNNHPTEHRTLPKTQSMQKSIPTISQTAIPNFDHIVVLLLENKPAESITDNSSAPYINSLMKKYSYTTNYSAVANPSLPNYLALIGGSTFNITSDCTSCFISSPDVVDNLEKAHKTWKAYMESMPSSCFIGSKDRYAQKHNPFIYFDDIRNNKDRCKNIVPYTELSGDLIDVKSTPHFVWITPDLCSDMHDCSVAHGDEWLSKQVPSILNSPSFTSQSSLLIITFDEGDKNNNKILTIFVGSQVKHNFVSHSLYTHYSLLHTIEASWGLPSLTENDANADVMKDLFR